ncbi:DUF58 domain-containing protein [Cytobacillus massiliigabonensis]|uniref:DUF58 domain-containing protein n=1 Tax=Cytobacillus massiliigabonensis TaxID=1871011 RepID=UPI000C867327|nr:DUF58 domain-containing protein [Cytobacillus massiliigabonensis]
MEWKKYSVEDNTLSITGILATFLFFASFYFQSWLVFLTAVTILIFIFANSLYLKYVGEHLHFENTLERNKFFPEEKGEWELTFANKGFPIMKGNLRIYFDDIVIPIDGNGEKRSNQFELNIPFSLNYNQIRTLKIPFKTRKRGVAKIRRMEWHIPHFFGLGETVLEYKSLIVKEALIYPLPITVKNTRTFLSARPGESYVSHSLYEDYLLPAGTRNYVYSDSFNRINWKASARMQTLQTKIFDRVADVGWHLSLNIADNHAVTPKLEQLLSSVTELAYFCAKHNIPYSLCINMRFAGAIPFYYIPAGSGKEQLQKVLEALAIVDQHPSILPYEKMLSFYHHHLTPQPYFIHGGRQSPRSEELINFIQKNGATILEINLDGSDAALMLRQAPVNKGVGT